LVYIKKRDHICIPLRNLADNTNNTTGRDNSHILPDTASCTSVYDYEVVLVIGAVCNNSRRNIFKLYQRVGDVNPHPPHRIYCSSIGRMFTYLGECPEFFKLVLQSEVLLCQLPVYSAEACVIFGIGHSPAQRSPDIHIDAANLYLLEECTV
jgi:hypothetical protein